MKTSSAKAKSRRAAQEVKDLLLKASDGFLEENDIIVTSSGETGEDLKFSPKAQERFRIVVEVKNQEKLNIWASLKQSESHKNDKGYTPCLFFRRNRSDMYVCLKASDFLSMVF